MRRGVNELLKRLYEEDNDGNIIKIYTKREDIEEQLIKYNKKHYNKVFNTAIYQDKIYEKL